METEFVAEITNDISDKEEDVELFVIKTNEFNKESFAEEDQFSNYFDIGVEENLDEHHASNQVALKP